MNKIIPMGYKSKGDPKGQGIMKERILIIEDDEGVRQLLEDILTEEYDTASAQRGSEALNLLRDDSFSLMIVDLRLPDINGMDIIRQAKRISPHTVSLVITGYGSIESAVEATKLGVYNYLTKPFSRDQLLFNVKGAIEHHHLLKENEDLRETIERTYALDNIIGKSQAMLEVFDTIRKVADTDATVLITGESGTGKELIARAIHYNSARKKHPFIPINCGAIPQDLLESELFGHEKGAFTGAVSARQGRFERADKGTLFLDEIGELPLHLQVKLLRVLQEKEFERVGGNRTIKVDVRIIAATNKNLEEAIENKTFREDLYYRLNVIPIYVPPLRERKGDIPLLVNHFLKKLARTKKKRITGVDPAAMEMLMNYDWPGNIRELENIIERTVILKEDEGLIKPRDLPAKIREAKNTGVFYFDIPKDGIDLPALLEELETRFIKKALDRAGGVKTKAAQLLGINRTTLIEKMRKRGMLSTAKAPSLRDKAPQVPQS